MGMLIQQRRVMQSARLEGGFAGKIMILYGRPATKDC